LQKLKKAGDDKNNHRDRICRSFRREYKESGKNPENFIKDPSPVVIEPPGSRPRMEFEGEAGRRNDQKRESCSDSS